MADRASTLDMPQEFISQALSFRRAFDESGNIRDDEAVIRAKMRFEGRERVCAHFRMRARECIQKRRLPGTRKADKSHVGYHLEFESEVKTLARFPFLRIHRRRVRRRAEMEVPPAAESAVRDEKLFAFFR